eukprot:4349722-Prorocentrum_lima.AAC.1
MEERISLCLDQKTIQGAYIASVRPNGYRGIGVASAPVPWPHDDMKGTWKIEEEPSGKQRTWISNKGES